MRHFSKRWQAAVFSLAGIDLLAKGDWPMGGVCERRRMVSSSKNIDLHHYTVVIQICSPYVSDRNNTLQQTLIIMPKTLRFPPHLLL